MIKRLLGACFYLTCFTSPLFAQQQLVKEQEEPLKIVKQFFNALKTHDTIAFKKIFLRNAYSYYVLDKQDSAYYGGKSTLPNVFKENRILDEHIRNSAVKVELHKRIAMVWVPYDLWFNQNFLYCGVDVFTLIKTNEGWKIATLSFSVETDGCGNK